MEKAYIILAHRYPGQVERLMRRLDDDHSTFFLHIDLKSALEEFTAIEAFGEKVKLVKRVVTNWAEFGLVQATVNALEAIKECGKSFARIILLSGQDYPIKSNSCIDAFFLRSPHSVFIESVIIPDFKRWKPGGGMYRVSKYFLGWKQYQRYAAKTFNFLGIILPFLKRKAPNRYIPYAGSQWWTIDMYALDYILDYIHSNRSYDAFHRSTFAPDELYFHGILLNTDDPQLRERICNTHLRYMNWEDTSKGHPEVLVRKDFQDISLSDALFARKFDESIDREIFDLIDHECLSEKRPVEPILA